MEKTIVSLRKRANDANLSGKIGILATVLVGVVFFVTLLHQYDNWISKLIGIELYSFEDPVVKKEIIEETNEEKYRRLYFEQLEEKIDLEKEIKEKKWWINEGARALSIISLFAFCIYVVRVALMFSKFQFKIAIHLNSVADALEAFPDDPDEINKFISATKVTHIGFGRDPETLHESLIKSLKDLKSLKDIKL